MKKLITAIILASLLLASCGDVQTPADGAGRVTALESESRGEESIEADASASEDTSDEPVEGTGYASYSGTEAGGDLTYVTHKGKTITDFSFLDGLSRNFFSDEQR